MNIKLTPAKTTTNHVSAALFDATHFKHKDATYPLHQIVNRTDAQTKDHYSYLGSHGQEYPLRECTLLKAVKTVVDESYTITLTEGEAQVLAEVLRHTRVGGTPHKDVHAVCSELWNRLPTNGNTTLVAGAPIHVSKA